MLADPDTFTLIQKEKIKCTVRNSKSYISCFQINKHIGTALRKSFRSGKVYFSQVITCTGLHGLSAFTPVNRLKIFSVI